MITCKRNLRALFIPTHESASRFPAAQILTPLEPDPEVSFSCSTFGLNLCALAIVTIH